MNPGTHPRNPRGLGDSGGHGAWRSGLSRRSFLARTAGAGLAAGGLGSLVTACGSGAVAAPRFAPLPTPKKPVRWPILAANRPIRGGKIAEANATLQVCTWVNHVSRRCVDDFSRKYRCRVELTTFATITEALATLKRTRRQFDVFLGAPTNILGVLIGRGAIQPLNHSYIPNIRHVWQAFADPYYDSHWLYTVPYTVYTTGIAWRKDLVDVDPYALVDGWGFPWVAKASGKTAILDDCRESIALALLYNGITDVNTTDPLILNTARQALLSLKPLVGLRIGNDTSQQLATGQSWIHHAWSGQVVKAAHLLPRGVPVEAIGYWFPPDGKGPVANDTGTVLRGAQNPVLAHLFLNFLLNQANAMHNIAGTGYMQPLTFATPQRLVSEGIVPASLTSGIALSTYLDHGYKEVELQPAPDQLWRQAWRAVSHAP